MENKPESLARPISPYSQSQNSKPPNASQYTSPSVKQQPTRSYSRDEPPKQNQAGIYCEPELMTDAWKTHGYGDSEGEYTGHHTTRLAGHESELLSSYITVDRLDISQRLSILIEYGQLHIKSTYVVDGTHQGAEVITSF